mmetsp:Transcript_90583/g.236097  ORF Transcript_90583/g.236097 Transcript_90583/m.236097 type:complete len:415 (-) Transcript_90583:94-1338(-)
MKIPRFAVVGLSSVILLSFSRATGWLLPGVAVLAKTRASVVSAVAAEAFDAEQYCADALSFLQTKARHSLHAEQRKGISDEVVNVDSSVSDGAASLAAFQNDRDPSASSTQLEGRHSIVGSVTDTLRPDSYSRAVPLLPFVLFTTLGFSAIYLIGLSCWEVPAFVYPARPHADGPTRPGLRQDKSDQPQRWGAQSSTWEAQGSSRQVSAPSSQVSFASPLAPRPGSSGSVSSSHSVDLPCIYPALVMRSTHARLAIPSKNIRASEFELDVLGVSGVPLLGATLALRADGQRKVEISFNRDNLLLAVVGADLRICDAQGALVGSLSKVEEDRYGLYDGKGRLLMMLLPQGDAGDVRMIAQGGSSHKEKAHVFHRQAGRLPDDHFEVVVRPGVDAVLVLACFFALIVFNLPRASLS